jgi:hypothetical protein
MNYLIYPLLLLVFNFSCTQPKKTGEQKSKNQKKEGLYELKIISDGQFTALLSTKEQQSQRKGDLIKFDEKDTIGKLWRIKIKTTKNFTMDSSFHVRNLGALKSQLNGVFQKIPFESPKNCNYRFNNNKFEAIESVAGNQIDTSKLNKYILTKIKNKGQELSINYNNAYKKPKYSLNDRAAVEGLKSLKKCLASEITYKFNNAEVKITKKDFAELLKLDSNMHAELITVKGARLIQKIANEFDIIEKSITFTTNAGLQKTIEHSELGKRIDVYRELSKLEKDIISGEKVEREPIYGMKGLPNGVFDSNKNYVEVSISDQKIWFYKNGDLITESNIVTGCPRRGHSTPPGAYYVKYKGRNVVLDGPGYSSRVSFWMPFNKGIGLHDARWRRKFGQQIYISDGSHGCVNLPKATAQLLFEQIQPGSIIICY